MLQNHKLRQLIRVSIASILYWVGALHFLLWLRLRNRAIVLMYHRVVSKKNLDKIFSHPGIVVETETFEKHLRFLCRYFRVVSLDEFKERMITGQPFQDRICLITFDDGWQDNFNEAFPVLERYGLPAVIFLPVGFIGTRKRFWQESLTHSLLRVLEQSNGKIDSVHGAIFARLGLDMDALMSDQEGKTRIQEKVGQAKVLSENEIKDLLNEMSETMDGQHSPKEHPDTFLTWEQVKRMAMGQIRFGSHTINHKILTKVPLDQAQKEVKDSKRAIQNELGDEILAFSYPNGNYNVEIKEMVISNGYQLGFSTEAGLVSSEDDRFTIKRVNIHQGAASSIPLFLARIIGMF